LSRSRENRNFEKNLRLQLFFRQATSGAQRVLKQGEGSADGAVNVLTIIVLTNDISARQWLGRLFNEVGLCADHDPAFQIRFVGRIEDASDAAAGLPSDSLLTVVWSSGLPSCDLPRVARLPGRLLLVNHSADQDRFYLDHPWGTHILQQDLDARRLLELTRLVPT
jgi:hypothetical protein